MTLHSHDCVIPQQFLLHESERHLRKTQSCIDKTSTGFAILVVLRVKNEIHGLSVKETNEIIFHMLVKGKDILCAS